MNHVALDTRHVFLCVDANFVVPLGVTLRSLAETQSEPSLLCVTVLHAGTPERDHERLRASVPELSVRFVPIEERLPTDIPSVGHINRTAYGRLFGVDLLPSDAARAVYFDSDLLITTDIGF